MEKLIKSIVCMEERGSCIIKVKYSQSQKGEAWWVEIFRILLRTT